MLPSLKAIEEQDLVLLARFTPNERGFEEIHAVIRFSTIPSFPSFLGNFLPAGSRQGHKTCAPFFFFFRVCMICFPTFSWAGSLVPQSVKNNIICPGLSRLKILPSAR